MLGHSYAYSYLSLGGEGEEIFLSCHSKLGVSEKVANEKHFWSPTHQMCQLPYVKEHTALCSLWLKSSIFTNEAIVPYGAAVL